MRLITLRVALCFATLVAVLPVFAQKPASKPSSQSPQPFTVRPYTLSAAPTTARANVPSLRTLNLDKGVLSTWRAQAPNQVLLQLELPSLGSVPFQMEESGIIPANQIIQVTGGKTVEADRGLHYRAAKGEAGIGGGLSLFDLGKGNYQLSGMVTYKGQNYVIGPDTKGNHVVYQDAELPNKNPFNCHMEELPSVAPRDSRVITNPKNAPQAPPKSVKLFIEADNRAYTDNGSSVSATVAWINSIWNVVGVFYSNIGVPIEVVQTYINTSPDNYPTNSSLAALNAFQDSAAKRQHIGNLAHLLSTKPTQLGGIAYLSVLCNTSLNIAFSNTFFSYATLPTYSWTINVTAHEMGHNMSSNHTQWCGWQKSPGVFGMIDSCYTAENAGSGVCYSGPKIPRAGTLMSYCHLNGSVDFTQGFGPLPSAAITAYYNAASCLTATGALKPIVSAFTPTTAAAGQTVTITGSNFTGATAVNFGSSLAASFTVNSATSITAVVGGGSSGSVSVTNPSGVGSKTGFVFSTSSSPLAITGFTPTQGPVGERVRIRGTRLNTVAAVYFNTTLATTWAVSGDTLITALEPAGATYGRLGVSTSAAPGSAIVQSAAYFFPTGNSVFIIGFTPRQARYGDTVYVTGRKLNSFTGVRFNGALALFASSRGDSLLKAVVPVGATTGKITISATGPQTCQTATDLTVILPPSITSFSPLQGPIGERVRLRGTGFSRVGAVYYGTNKLTQFAASGDTVLTVIVSAGTVGNAQFGVQEGQTAGTQGGTGTIYRSAAYFQLTNFPFIRAFTPTSGTVSDTVYLVGRQLTGYSTVRFNGATASFTQLRGDTFIKAVVPTGSSTGLINATNASNNTIFSPTAFTFLSPPTITSFSPGSGPVGDRIRIRGTRLSLVRGVYFGLVQATDWATSGDTLLTAIVPPGTINGKIGVVSHLPQPSTPIFVAQSAAFFNILYGPVIRHFSPLSGKAGDTVRVFGRTLATTLQVKFSNGTILAPYKAVVNDTLVKTIVPVGATTGYIRVINTSFSLANSATSFVVTAGGANGKLGIEEGIAGLTGLALFPNPTEGSATLRVSGAATDTEYTLIVLSADGRQVYKGQAEGQALVAGIALPVFTPGFYQVRVQAGKAALQHRLVVQ